MLGGLALKWRWRKRREAAGLSTDKPNLVMGSERAGLLGEVLPLLGRGDRAGSCGPDVTRPDRRRCAAAHCDENTIGVVPNSRVDLRRQYEPVAEIASALDDLAANDGPDVPIHVDAASGGFVAPFFDPDLEWDFRVPRVQSINASGHKFGLRLSRAWAGSSGAIAEALPQDLVFDVNYLGGHMPTFALNFSRPGAQVVAQYYMFLRLGREGYRRVQEACCDTASWIAPRGRQHGAVRSRLERARSAGSCVQDRRRVAPSVSTTCPRRSVRGVGWCRRIRCLRTCRTSRCYRVVVRNGMSRDMASMLVNDLKSAVTRLERGARCRRLQVATRRGRASTTRAASAVQVSARLGIKSLACSAGVLQ